MNHIYSPLNSSAFYMMQRRQRIIRKIIAKAYGESTQFDLSDIKLLEIGCGNGQWLTEFQMLGLKVDNLSGIELDEKRASKAKKRIIGGNIKTGNAAEMPWKDDSFDIVFQSTVFTSILDNDVRIKAASEMKRVCKKEGFILWYDFAFDSPSNKNVKGIKKCEIRNLFKPWNCEFTKVTLAPPIARRLVPISWLIAEGIETFFPFLRTHIIAKISK